MESKRQIVKCDICGYRKLDCERKHYGKVIVDACKECQEEMKLTQIIISHTAKRTVVRDPEHYSLWIKEGKVCGVCANA